MIIRILAILACVVVFINGCNSLISQHFGTHKLRAYSIEEVLQQGVGDADFVEIDGGWLSGDFVYKAAKSPSNPGVIIYPVLSREQLEQHRAGNAVEPAIIAWTTNFHSPCVEENNCIEEGPLVLKGIIRDLPKDRRGAGQLEDKGFTISTDVILIDHGQSPLAWYWNALMMAGAAALAFAVEAYNQKRRQAASAS